MNIEKPFPSNSDATEWKVRQISDCKGDLKPDISCRIRAIRPVNYVVPGSYKESPLQKTILYPQPPQQFRTEGAWEKYVV